MLRISTIDRVQGYEVRLRLTDGSTRVVDLLPFLEGPSFRALLEDASLFRQVGVLHGTLSWPTGQDLDPDVLLSTEISRRGVALPCEVKTAICKFDRMTMYLGASEQSPPHLDVEYRSSRARVRIDDGTLIHGQLPAAQLGAVQQWLRKRRPEVALEWVRAASGREPRSVPSL
jgi:hypothetical protein